MKKKEIIKKLNSVVELTELIEHRTDIIIYYTLETPHGSFNTFKNIEINTVVNLILEHLGLEIDFQDKIPERVTLKSKK